MFTYASFFKDINSQKRTPFNVTPAIANNGVIGKALDFTSTFVEAQDDFSLIIDCVQFVGMHFKEKSLSSCLREQFPKGLGIRHRVVGKNHKVIEINFPTEEDCMVALQKEFVLQGTTIQVNKTLDKHANIFRVNISAIPYKSVEVLQPMLIDTFTEYGDILNVGLCHSKDGDWFTGRGFVTLNIDQSKQYAAELRPQVAFAGSQENLRLTWANMQPICADCHTDDHVKADCPRKRRKTCHKCGSLEHLIAACPQAYWNRKKEQPSQERRRRNSNTQANTPAPKPTGREVDLLELMQVPKPKYLTKTKQTARDESSMEISDTELVTSVAPSTPVQDASMQEIQETIEPHGTEALAEPSSTEDAPEPSNNGSAEEDKLGTIQEAQPANQPAEPSSDESEYDESTGTGGEESDSLFTPSFRDRYNLRDAKPKASSRADTVPVEASHKRNKMDSTPMGSDEEGHAKKLFKQQEDIGMTDVAIGSINCRNLYKQYNITSTNNFIRYLKGELCNILLCQETNVQSHSFESITTNFKYQFQYHQAIWTRHCGIINFNQALHLQQLHVFDEGRGILAKISLVDHNMPPIYVLNLYAHADDYRARNQLFGQIIRHLKTMPEIIPSLIIAGDMNYSFDTTTYHHTHRAGKPKQFIDFLNTHFSDCLNPKNEPHTYTFQRGSTMSTLDYMFAGHDIASKMSDATNSFIGSDWTDHALLTKTYTTGLTNCGKGIWRANPHLAKNPKYRQKLDDELRTFVAVKLDKSLSAQEQWDLLKKKAKQVTIQFTRTHDQWRKARIKELQRERNNLMRRYRNDTACLRLLLQDIESELSRLQQEIVDIQLLKAGKRWFENSEKSPGYIKQTIKQRLDQRTIPNLKHPRTGQACL
ncbi:hypothetical protein MAM1_0803d11256, partial [Mucor ambiguus]